MFGVVCVRDNAPPSPAPRACSYSHMIASFFAFNIDDLLSQTSLYALYFVAIAVTVGFGQFAAIAGFGVAGARVTTVIRRDMLRAMLRQDMACVRARCARMAFPCGPPHSTYAFSVWAAPLYVVVSRNGDVTECMRICISRVGRPIRHMRIPYGSRARGQVLRREGRDERQARRAAGLGRDEGPRDRRRAGDERRYTGASRGVLMI